MELKTLNTRTSHSRNIRSCNTPVFTCDLPALIKNMKQSAAWENGELISMILLQSPRKQIVLTIMHESTEVESFQSGDSVTFQIIEGKMKFQSRKETVTLAKGQSLTLYDSIKFNLTTMVESAFLLIIHTGGLKVAEN